MSTIDSNAEYLNKKPTFLFGKIIGFHGLDGEVKVRPEANKPEILANVIHLRTKNTPHVPSMDLIIDSSHFDKRMYYLCFTEFPDRTSAEILMGAELMTWEEEVGGLDEEEFWVKDLVGMVVFKDNGEEVGKVIDIIYAGNDILEIRRDADPAGKTILIPFVKNLVPTVNMKDKKIFVTDLPGLFEAQ